MVGSSSVMLDSSVSWYGLVCNIVMLVMDNNVSWIGVINSIGVVLINGGSLWQVIDDLDIVLLVLNDLMFGFSILNMRVYKILIVNGDSWL